jgi:hypothetical protein
VIPPGTRPWGRECNQNGAIRDPRKVHFSRRLLRTPPAAGYAARTRSFLETTFESLDSLRREITVAWSVFMNWRCRVASTASKPEDRAVYALFMKLDDVKYGFFMRLDTHKTEVVAEL